jgi:hypothetical protein
MYGAMTEQRKPRSESLLSEIRELTEKVREVRLELESLVERPEDRSAWRMLSSHGERSLASDRGRGRDRAADRSQRRSNRPAADLDYSALEPDPHRDDDQGDR